MMEGNKSDPKQIEETAASEEAASVTQATSQDNESQSSLKLPPVTTLGKRAPEKEASKNQPSDEAYAKIDEFDHLKKLLDKGLPLPVRYAEPDLSEHPQMIKRPRIEPFVLCEELRIEFKLLSLKKIITHSLIKDSQGQSRIDFARAASALDSMSILDLNKEMLLKNPEVVDTIRKLQRYSVHPDTTFKDGVERHLASIKAANLRCKANSIVKDKFTPLFTIPPGFSFYEIYCTEMERYIDLNNNAHLTQRSNRAPAV